MSPTAPAAASLAAHGLRRALPRTRLEAHLLDALAAGERVRLDLDGGGARSGPVEAVDLDAATVRVAGLTVRIAAVDAVHRPGHEPVRGGS